MGEAAVVAVAVVGVAVVGATVEFDAAVTMRDGVVLRADVFRPDGAGPWPVLLVRTPYDKQDSRILGILNPLACVRRGYIVAIVDTRGRFHSGGEWEPLRHERSDGHDSVRWAAGLAGSTGRVGMYGPSYLGNVQWQAAVSAPPELAAIVPVFTWADPMDGLVGRGGARELGLGASWSLSQGPDLLRHRFPDQPAVRRKRLAALVGDIDAFSSATYWELPTGTFPPLGRHEVPGLGGDGTPGRVAGTYHEVAVPAFNVGGWFDCFLQGTLDNYVGLRAAGQPSTLLVGPWSHSNQTNQHGELNFGVSASETSIGLRSSLHDLQLDFLDRWLRPAQTPAWVRSGVPSSGAEVESLTEAQGLPPSAAPVRIFVTGANVWRDEDDWPLARARDTPLFLGPDATLAFAAPDVAESSDRYSYDPADPVITHGGAILMSSDYQAGPLDQSRVEQRPDVLVYSTPPLPHDVEVTGRIRVLLYAGSSAPTTDWVARVCDVDGHGVSRNLTDGIIRVPGNADEVAEHEIDLWSVAHVFRRGHRIRLQITSSNFPRWDRNLNTDDPVDMKVAEQEIHHDAYHPSRIILPIVPS